MAKPKKLASPSSYEDFLAIEFSSQRYEYIPPINYPYKIGDPVELGYLSDCRVEAVLDNGWIHVSYHDRGEKYGIPFDNQRRLPRVIPWNQLNPIETIEATSFGREDSLRTQFNNEQLSGLLFRIYSRGLLDSPTYQRDYVWSLQDKQRLIHSIFDNTDIGKFVLMSHPWPENRLEVVDGKQRLKALMEFQEGRFPYQEKTWFQLSVKDKRKFNGIQVQVTELQSEFVKQSDVLRLFLSINHSGVPQTEEHLAKVKELYQKALEEEGSK